MYRWAYNCVWCEGLAMAQYAKLPQGFSCPVSRRGPLASRWLPGIVGVLLVTTGAVSAYFWFYLTAPMRHLADDRWCSRHSRTAIWAETQKHHRRTGGSPDIMAMRDPIGVYGDKEWFAWCMRRMQESEHWGWCGCTTDHTLPFMANRKCDSRDEWLEWYKAHADESQEEWIADGFRPYGVGIQLEPEESNAVALLGLIGGEAANGITSAVPGYVRYNAKRWLRDSDYWPTDVSQISLSSPAGPGLLHYAVFLGRTPKNLDLGVLDLGEPISDYHRIETPGPGARAKRWAINISIPSAILAGIVLLVTLPFRRRRRECLTQDSTVPSDTAP